MGCHFLFWSCRECTKAEALSVAYHSSSEHLCPQKSQAAHTCLLRPVPIPSDAAGGRKPPHKHLTPAFLFSSEVALGE